MKTASQSESINRIREEIAIALSRAKDLKDLAIANRKKERPHQKSLLSKPTSKRFERAGRASLKK